MTESRESLTKTGLFKTFVTPVLVHEVPGAAALNTKLAPMILAAARRGPGEPKNVVGGWSSLKDLLAWQGDAFVELRELFQAAAIEITKATTMTQGQFTFSFHVEAWANVLRSGGYHALHNHAPAMWSGVYYVADGAPAPEPTPGPASTPALNGRLELFDSRAGVGSASPDSILNQQFRVSPQPGLMVVFPGWLNHMVHPFVVGRERISISFNVFDARVRAAGEEATTADGGGAPVRSD